MRILCSLLLLTGFSTQAQINTKLKHELDSIYITDQKYRELMSIDVPKDSLAKVFGVKPEDLITHLWSLQLAYDSANIVRVEEIISQYGYPGKSLVGTPTEEAAWHVIQHSNNINKHLPLIEQAAKKGELPFRLYAMMLDRSLMYAGKEQLYGTQGRSMMIKNVQTGKPENFWFIWPISDPAKVNERRQNAGFPSTVEENAKRLGIAYRVVTLDEINKLQANNK